MTIPRNLLTLLIAWAVSCTALAKDDPIYSGEYFYNFENSYLTPDGKNEAWCISSGMSKAMLPAADTNGQWGTSHVVVRGKLGPKGSYGGLGRCNRVLTLTKLVKVTNMRGPL